MATIGTETRPAYVYNVETDTWIPIGVGAHTHPQYVDASAIEAKGDLVVGVGVATTGKLDVGTNGQVLVANSATETGLVWETLNALPLQSGNTGKYLTTNGSTASWAEIVTDPNPQIFMLMGA